MGEVIPIGVDRHAMVTLKFTSTIEVEVVADDNADAEYAAMQLVEDMDLEDVPDGATPVEVDIESIAWMDTGEVF